LLLSGDGEELARKLEGMSIDECGISLLRRISESTNDEGGADGIPMTIES
jgi:hypothetical protein